MTREEAIKELIAFKDKSWDGMPEEVIDVAIEALKQEPCEDAVSRQAAIDAIYARYIGGKEAVDKAPASDHYAEGIDEAVCAVEDLPPVTPQPKTGRWEEIKSLCGGKWEMIDNYKCSVCGELEVSGNDYKYCPNCGAKMEVEG